MSRVAMVGIGLSVLGFGVLLVLLRDLWSRARIPAFEYGGLHLSARAMRWAWTALFVVAFSAGGPAISRVSHSSVDAASGRASPEAAAPRRSASASWRVRLASYATSHGTTLTGTRTERTWSDALYAPFWLPLAMVLYWLAVVRGREGAPHETVRLRAS